MPRQALLLTVCWRHVASTALAAGRGGPPSVLIQGCEHGIDLRQFEYQKVSHLIILLLY